MSTFFIFVFFETWFLRKGFLLAVIFYANCIDCIANGTRLWYKKTFMRSVKDLSWIFIWLAAVGTHWLLTQWIASQLVIQHFPMSLSDSTPLVRLLSGQIQELSTGPWMLYFPIKQEDLVSLILSFIIVANVKLLTKTRCISLSLCNCLIILFKKNSENSSNISETICNKTSDFKFVITIITMNKIPKI